MVKFAIRTLRTGGVQIIRLGERGNALLAENASKTFYPVTCYNGWNRAKDAGLAKGAHFLGLLWGSWDEPKETRQPRIKSCSERGCPFPRMERSSLCRQHRLWETANCSYPREQKLDRRESFSRKSDDKSVGSGFLDATFHNGWLGEDKYGFLHTTTLKPNRHFVQRDAGERANDKWWKENVVDQGIEAPGVMVRKTSKELKAEMEEMIDRSLAEYSAQQSEANIRSFWRATKEPSPLHKDPFRAEGPRMKIGDGAAVSLKGKMRRGGGHGLGIRKKQRKRAAGWTSSRHNHDPQYFTRDTIRTDVDQPEFHGFNEEMPDTYNMEEA